MTDKPARFKIDLDSKWHKYPALFARRILRKFPFFRRKEYWVQLDYETKIEDLKAIYDRIKDLPEYLP